MTLRKLISSIVLILACALAHAHRDRVERPQTFRFIFHNHDTVTLTNPGDSVLKIYCDEILSHKRELIAVQLTFETGERMTLNYDSSKLTSIAISYKRKEIFVPREQVASISDINYQTILLLWDGRDKKAFKSPYLYIEFQIGTDKSVDNIRTVDIHFSELKFSRMYIGPPRLKYN